MKQPRITRLADRALNPLIGKSVDRLRGEAGASGPRTAADAGRTAVRSAGSRRAGSRQTAAAPRAAQRTAPGRLGCARFVRLAQNTWHGEGWPCGDRRGAAPSASVPEVAGVLTADQILATGQSIAAVQQRDGAIGWPDGHVDAWNHVECAMALSACGLLIPPGAATSGWALPSAPTAPGRGDRRTGGHRPRPRATTRPIQR